MKNRIILLFIFFSVSFWVFGEEARLMRFPDINKDLVVFVYAGDIWSVSADGGEARHLTSHKGLELFPKISPDGKWIAFSAEYSGSRQVYVMNSSGGQPKQLTFYNDVGIMPPRGGWDYVVLDWTPDSKKILFRANRTPYGRRAGKYFLVAVDGGLETPLQIPDAGFGSFSPDGTKICYTPVSREFRTWKRYKGGRAADVWTYDLINNFSTRLTTFPGSDQIPSWYKNKIYYASDQSLTLNIFSYDLNTGKKHQITRHSEYDVMWPSGEGKDLVYENGGFLYKLNLDTDVETKIRIKINYDSPNTLPYYKSVKDNIYSFAISPTGKRALFGSRGDVFSVPEKHGETQNLTSTQGVREIFPAWSPDGRNICYFSDLTGEYEIYLQNAQLKSSPRQITRNSKSWKFPAVWSPDSQKLLFSDKSQKLQILDIKSGSIAVADKASRFDLTDYCWSPDSLWIVYSKDVENGQSVIWAYSLTAQTTHQLTDGTFNDFAPVFSTCGNYLFFLSNRDFNLSFSSFEFDYLYNNATRIYAFPLNSNTPPIFKDKEDKEKITIKKPDLNSAGNKNAAVKMKKTMARFDFKGLNSRIIAFPVANGNYNYIEAIDTGIIYIRDRNLYKFDIANKKEEMVLAAVDRVVLTADKKRALYRSGNNFGIIPVKADQKPGTGQLDLKDLVMRIEPLKEWQQIYNDGWRIFRDWFYAANIHGVDWNKMKLKYQKLVPYVKHRADLDYIFGELVGESNTGHCYVQWGDFERIKRLDTGLLGAELKADTNSGRYRISKIYQGENWNNNRRSPLTDQGVNIKAGDFLISLNGNNVTIKDNPYRFLENTVGKRIPIAVSSNGSAASTRTYFIKPIASELQLFYLDWVNSRRTLVQKLSQGKIGYIHVPNTAGEGNRELYRGLYAYHNKQALIIDERYNGGGFIPGVMVELLNRSPLSYWSRRGLKPFRTPGILHSGPKVMLINQYASSGGDAFPYYFKKMKLGKLIGTRTWGGLVGLSGNASFSDGGSILVPTFGIFDTEGNWTVEGIGVYPDIEVIDLPHLVAAGRDPSIEKAVEVLLKMLKENPPKKIKEPKHPDRSKWIEQEIKN